MLSGCRKILPLALVVLALDQATKLLVVRTLDLGHARTVIEGFFNLVHVRNRGAAFGILNRGDTDWQRWFFVGASLLAVLVILRIAATTRHESRPLFAGLGLLLGGALGNLFDRLFRQGLVVDFLDFHLGTFHWPAFNVADSAITVGVVALLAALYRQR